MTASFNFSNAFYRAATLPAFAISAVLTYLLVEYSIHGAQALESNDEMKALAALVAVVLALSQIAGPTYASLLAGQGFALRCFSLRALAYFICAVEFFVGVGMLLSGTLGADMAQVQVSAQEESLKARIKRFEDTAREKQQGALKQEEAACKIKDGKRVCGAWELNLAAKQRQGAAADTNKAESLQAELKAVQAQKSPTFVGSVGQAGGILGFQFDAGKAFAVGLIVARMLCLCVGALLFSELAGSLLRRGWPGFNVAAGGGTVPPPAKRPTPPVPAEPRTRTLRARLETGKAMIASEKKEPDAPVQVRPDDTPAAPVADALAPADALAQVQDASVQVQGESAAIPPCPDGVRNAIKAGVTSPTLRGVMKHGRGQEFAAAWLAELGAEGVLEPAGRGRWKLAKTKD